MARSSTSALALVAGLTLSLTAAAQPPATPPAAPAPATPPVAAPAQPVLAPAAPPAVESVKVEPKKWEIAADAKPAAREEREGGLIVEDFVVGTGYEVKEGGAVVAHYHGTLREGGTVFDSSFVRGEPVAFPLSGVIQGWQKGVPGMKIGGLRRLTIPWAMAYGEAGRPPTIPAKADLVFVIELVEALQVEDVKVGTGEEVGPRPVCVTMHTASVEGKPVETCGADSLYVWLPGENMGVNFGLEGMKVGGKRKLTIPAAMNQLPQGLETKRPGNVPMVVELDLVAVRNLVPVQPKVAPAKPATTAEPAKPAEQPK